MRIRPYIESRDYEHKKNGLIMKKFMPCGVLT